VFGALLSKNKPKILQNSIVHNHYSASNREVVISGENIFSFSLYPETFSVTSKIPFRMEKIASLRFPKKMILSFKVV